jgi:hypothetical protein
MRPSSSTLIAYLHGRLESGQERQISIEKVDNVIKAYIRGYNSKNPKIDKENINKLFSIIDDDKIPNYSYVDRYDKFKKNILNSLK